MNDLIEALKIFSKYENLHYPTFCEHDVLGIAGIEPESVSEEDKHELERLGFFVSEEYYGEVFISSRFGSC